MQPCPDDIREFWKLWINTGWFDWESEGFPQPVTRKFTR